MRSQNKDRKEGRDLVNELIGEESEDEYTHKPDGTYEILNDIVVDRGPNPSTSERGTPLTTAANRFPSNVFNRGLWR